MRTSSSRKLKVGLAFLANVKVQHQHLACKEIHYITLHLRNYCDDERSGNDCRGLFWVLVWNRYEGFCCFSFSLHSWTTSWTRAKGINGSEDHPRREVRIFTVYISIESLKCALV